MALGFGSCFGERHRDVAEAPDLRRMTHPLRRSGLRAMRFRIIGDCATGRAAPARPSPSIRRSARPGRLFDAAAVPHDRAIPHRPSMPGHPNYLQDLLTAHLRAFLGQVDPVVLDLLQRQLVWKELPGGQALMTQGEPGDAMYVLVSGRLRA